MFIVLEIQKSNSGSVAIVPPASYEDRNNAEEKFHQSLAAAAVSNIDVHSVVLLSDKGEWLDGKTYYHGA